MRSSLCTLTKQTIDCVLCRTSTKQRSMKFVVRKLRHKWRGKLKKANSSGRPRSKRIAMPGYVFFQ